MEGSGAGISRLDCYEDMFKEITRKLYGEDPDHRTSSVQNEFETSVSYKTEEDTGNGTDSDDGNWTCEEEPLKGTDGSRIAAYHAGKATWRCYECGDLMGGGPRDVAEHFMELHSSRILGDDSRNRHHSPSKDYLQSEELKVEDVISYLERLRERVERVAPPSRRTQETQTVPAALLPVTSTFLLQELPSAPAPQHLHQNTTTMSSVTVTPSVKRYSCPYCPYGTDRRDLYTRHENIHREEKPFHCYICYKPFNRADHVKKHFLRMHREHGYELSRIRRPAGSSPPKPLQQDAGTANTGNVNTNGQPQQQHTNYSSGFNNTKNYQLQPNAGNNTATNAGGIYQGTSMPAPGIMQPDAANCVTGRRVQNGGCNSKSHLKGSSKGAQERRYTCCYCSWSGVDNWCLKRHLNTHLKPFACTLCEYKAARAERLATHVLKVHNRRQCSRCSFLGEDAAQLQMHQLHVHRVSSANAPATSTTQATPPPTNRHQQPLHPAGGGRPPPGPPVFPAPAPAIAPATTVIPPTTILGHEMVNSPATAATMAYPTLEEERRSSWHEHGRDHDHRRRHRQHDANQIVDHHETEILRRDLVSFYAVYSSSVEQHDDRHVHDEPCTGCSSRDSTSTLLNRDFAHSYQAVPKASKGQSATEPYEFPWLGNTQNKPYERRPRKQSQPRKVTGVQEFDDEDTTCSEGENQDKKLEETTSSPVMKCPSRAITLIDMKARYRNQLNRRKLLKCHLCPKDAPARGSICSAYHTKVSLILHKLWRHRRNEILNNWIARNSSLSQPPSITLKATVFTNPGYEDR
ncbi:zinc finger transcriptional factor charlatan isoform X1 [Bombus fervidus]|uniref:zinc finger transcriptional factor charlatan isoform X1 n=2 Tax=Bombus fervidus TaxID=203811 RepID=UPI003AB13837